MGSSGCSHWLVTRGDARALVGEGYYPRVSLLRSRDGRCFCGNALGLSADVDTQTEKLCAGSALCFGKGGGAGSGWREGRSLKHFLQTR
jgi:hypothetical protein